MDLHFTEEQNIFRENTRRFLAKECPTSMVRELEESDEGYSPQIWNQIAELGWLGLALPETYGGVGGNWLDMTILYDEMGRAIFPSPHLATVVMAAQAILETGLEVQKREIISKTTSGEHLMTIAHLEPSFSFQPEVIATSAALDGDDYIINGTKIFVPNANIADQMIVSATVGDEVGLFLIDTHSKGIELTLLKNISEIAHEKQSEVILNEVRVNKKNIVGNIGDAKTVLSKIFDMSTIALCAEMVGGAHAVLDLSVEYTKEREAFGRKIGSYQALQHKMADMLVEIDGAELLTYQAACFYSENQSCTREIAMAKAWTSKAYRKITADAIQIHGAYGYCNEIDTTLYYRRAKMAEFAFGSPHYHRDKVASQIGLC